MNCKCCFEKESSFSFASDWVSLCTYFVSNEPNGFYYKQQHSGGPGDVRPINLRSV